MIYRTFRTLFWGIGLLAALSASAQEQEFDSELQLSNDEVIYWYRICSALPGMEGYAVTDFSEEDELYPVQLLQTEEKDYKSQWKLKAGDDGKVIIINRATEQELDGCSIDMGSCNVTQIMPSETTTGFKMTALGNNAFMLESVEDDGIRRTYYLPHSE